eukprot:SAG11_NODE_274_length_11310_cov_4.717510_11_plen_94_part_00
MKYSDARVKYILEVIQGIRIVKFMGWEAKFIEKIGGIRSDELRFFRSTAIVQATIFTLANTTPIAISLWVRQCTTICLANQTLCVCSFVSALS